MARRNGLQLRAVMTKQEEIRCGGVPILDGTRRYRQFLGFAVCTFQSYKIKYYDPHKAVTHTTAPVISECHLICQKL